MRINKSLRHASVKKTESTFFCSQRNLNLNFYEKYAEKYETNICTVMIIVCPVQFNFNSIIYIMARQLKKTKSKIKNQNTIKYT